MISRLSKIGLTIVLVASLILMCGCTGSQVAATATPTPAGTQQDTTNNVQTPTPTGSPTKNPTPAPTTEPSYMPTPISTDQKPSVVSAKTDKDTYTNDNEKVTLTIISSSDSKVTGYSLSLDGPDGNVMKGPAQIEATYLGNNQWENDVMFITDNTLTPGTYTWSRIQAINIGGLWSDYGPSASFKVTSA